jgi:hypothetical protein
LMTCRILLSLSLLHFSKVIKSKDLTFGTEIVKKHVPDVRDALRKFRDQMLDQISKGIQNPQLSLDWDKSWNICEQWNYPLLSNYLPLYDQSNTNTTLPCSS